MFLSVIIPVYNVDQYIGECLDSIVKQQADDMEVICVDDGSTDSSGIICEQYASKHKYFKVIHTVNKGVGAARNLGLKHAQGEYIAWIDPDDYITDDWHENIISALENFPCDILVFDYQIKKGNEYIIKRYGSKSQYVDRKKFLYDVVDDQIIQSQLWQKVLRRKVINELSFPTNIKCMEDYAVLHKIIEKCDAIYYLNKVIYTYRMREDGLVLEVNIAKSYECYLIAKERYAYLSERYFELSKIGYLMQALGVCIHFYKSSSAMRRPYIDELSICQKQIKENILYIIFNSRLDGKEKVKFLFCSLGILGISLKIDKFFKELH